MTVTKCVWDYSTYGPCQSCTLPGECVSPINPGGDIEEQLRDAYDGELPDHVRI